ncbi:STAS domain-containing protein [Streptomyces endophyticus]|uniref:STAS domain-containing protein n=1 Tax=Streptomyces endophyticus TaxID=714166 RepID=A0ABU6F5D8_9ACTN|nr:STAS domain-containing protein [Streptomyces endophyticus]MEB8338595.1 STAS domain-containing protein [Streptomyces endophyticus]
MAASSLSPESPPVVVLAGPIRSGDAPRLCERLHAALPGAPTVICDVSRVTTADLATLDALARMQLAARRAGSRMVLRDPPAGLGVLLELAGMADVLGAPDREGSGVEMVRDAEQREPALRVQEAVVPRDPPR